MRGVVMFLIFICFILPPNISSLIAKIPPVPAPFLPHPHAVASNLDTALLLHWAAIIQRPAALHAALRSRLDASLFGDVVGKHCVLNVGRSVLTVKPRIADAPVCAEVVIVLRGVGVGDVSEGHLGVFETRPVGIGGGGGAHVVVDDVVLVEAGACAARCAWSLAVCFGSVVLEIKVCVRGWASLWDILAVLGRLVGTLLDVLLLHQVVGLVVS